RLWANCRTRRQAPAQAVVSELHQWHKKSAPHRPHVPGYVPSSQSNPPFGGIVWHDLDRLTDAGSPRLFLIPLPLSEDHIITGRNTSMVKLDKQFECGQCGASLEYTPGKTHQTCPYCSHENPI